MSTRATDVLLQLVSDATMRREEADRHFHEAIRMARASGASLALIARAAGLSVSRIHAILGEESPVLTIPQDQDVFRPATSDEVLIVAAGKMGFSDYLRYAAYIFQPHRSFRDVDRMGFYRNGQIERYFPTIRYRRAAVQLTPQFARALRETGAPLDAELADVIERVHADPNNGHDPGDHQVFLLTEPDDPETLVLARPIIHRTSGRGTGWTRGTRYASEELLRREPATTAGLKPAWMQSEHKEADEGLGDPDVSAAIRAVRTGRHQSWSNVRKAIASLLQEPHEAFGTQNVAASAMSTVRQMQRRTGLSLVELREAVDRIAPAS